MINKIRSFNITLCIFAALTISTNLPGMQSLDTIFKDYLENKFEPYAENQFRLEATLRCSAGSFFLIGGDNPDAKGLGDYFRDLAFGFAFMLDEEKYSGNKTKAEIEKENNFLIKKYYDQYSNESMEWFKKNKFPDKNSKPSELFSDFFKNDMILCMDIYDAFEGKDE